MVLARRLGWPAFYLIDNAVGNSIRLGEWDWAAAELESMTGDDVEPLSRSVALADLLLIRAYRGEPTADLAADLFNIPSSGADSVKEVSKTVTTAAVAFVTGSYDLARTEYHRFAAIFNQGAAEAFLWAARCALLAGDLEGARQDLDQVDAIERRGRAIDAERKTRRAGVAALAGKPQEALALYRDATNVMRDLGLVWMKPCVPSTWRPCWARASPTSSLRRSGRAKPWCGSERSRSWSSSTRRWRSGRIGRPLAPRRSKVRQRRSDRPGIYRQVYADGGV